MGGVGLAAVVIVVVVLLVLGGLIGLFVLLFSVGARNERRRVGELTAYAAAHGMTYQPVDRSLVDRFAGQPFGRGSGRVARHVLQGTRDGRPTIAFEYQFATGTGDDRHRHVLHVVATALPVSVPRLELVPASTMGTFIDAFKGGDHQIGEPFFDAAYRIFTNSPEFAADVLSHPMRGWLFAQKPPYTRLRDADLVVVGAGALTGARADRALAYAEAFVARVPEQVWERAAG